MLSWAQVTEYIYLYELEHFLGARVAETLLTVGGSETGSASFQKMGALPLSDRPFLIYARHLCTAHDLSMTVYFCVNGPPSPMIYWNHPVAG
jgi:hypothetical protein